MRSPHSLLALVTLLALPVALSACDGGKGTDSSPSSDSTDDNADCVNTNEDCGPGTCGGEGPDMLPGADCLSCHDGSGGGGEDDEGGVFSAGGTVFADFAGSAGRAGATVRITDSTGHTETLTTSASGNFRTGVGLVPPLTAEVETADGTHAMGSTVNTGACNSCHACAGTVGGKLY